MATRIERLHRISLKCDRGHIRRRNEADDEARAAAVRPSRLEAVRILSNDPLGSAPEVRAAAREVLS